MCAIQQTSQEFSAKGEPREASVRKSRRGTIILIPWLMSIPLWLMTNRMMDDRTVIVYLFMALTSAVSFFFLIHPTLGEPRFADELGRIKTSSSIMFYCLFFMAMPLIFIGGSFVLNGAYTAGTVMPEIFVNKLISTMLVVAPVETFVFQWVYPKVTAMLLSFDTRLEVNAGYLSQVIFGVFHFTAYGGDVFSMLIAVGLGCLFYTIVRASPAWGLLGAMGAHAGYNISIFLGGM